MNVLETVLLGIMQGLTEFLPISSSGHLTLLQNLLGFKEPQLFLDVVLHLGTLFSICFYFRSDLKNMLTESEAFAKKVVSGQQGIKDISNYPHAAISLMVLIGTLPTVLIGVTFRTSVEKLFGSVVMVGFALLVTGLILLITRYIIDDEKRKDKILLITALCIGTAQGLALIPGISRSGTTIVCGMLLGLNRELAARFSFLLSIPAIIGAVVLHLIALPFSDLPFIPLTTGFIFAAVIGFMALKILMGVVKRGRLYYFSPYCWIVGLLAIFMGLMTTV
jgi:undecaprenyl-diphosphatase